MIQLQERDSSNLDQRGFFYYNADCEDEPAFFSSFEKSLNFLLTKWIQNPLFPGSVTQTLETDPIDVTYWEDIFQFVPFPFGHSWISITGEIENIYNVNPLFWKCETDYLGFDQIDDLFLYASQKEGARYISNILSKLSPEILQFSYKNGIHGFLPIAISIVRQKFRNLNEVRVQKEQDPETGEEWVDIQIEVSGKIDEVLSDFDKYTEKIVSDIPWPYRHKIRLSFDVQ